MKLSQTDISEFSDERKYDAVLGGVKDDGECSDVALLLGTSPIKCKERALAAAALYNSGRVKYILPTGGVEWDFDGKRQSEAEFMADVLVKNGVPAEAIILENEARTTKENMLYGAIQINRALRFEKVGSVIVVTSANHLKRSLALAHALLPRYMRISGCPATQPMPFEEWNPSDSERKAIGSELELMYGLAVRNFIEDLDI